MPILTAVKTLTTTCAMQGIAGQIIQIDIVSCTDTINIFPVSLFFKTQRKLETKCLRNVSPFNSRANDEIHFREFFF